MHLQLRAGQGQRSSQPAGPERLTHSRMGSPCRGPRMPSFSFAAGTWERRVCGRAGCKRDSFQALYTLFWRSPNDPEKYPQTSG
jgi:hypothetical protein